jgi:hypothetical protein
MTTIDRRTFLTTTALTVAATQLPAQAGGPARASLAPLPAAANGPHMPADFVGLSYELQQLTDPSFFSAANTGLIRQCRALAPTGVLRLGGNTSEFAWWQPTPETPEPPHPHTRIVEGEPKPQYYAVTPLAVRNLAAFLKAAGWSCIYGIGMGTNTPERAADEGAFVAQTLGASLQYFQIGNEVDLFDRHLRDPQTWSPQLYLDEWLGLARAIAARVPDAKFGMPDVVEHIDWLPQLAELWAAVQNPPRLTTLTHHYYFGGPATNPEINIPNLLQPATMAKVQHTAEVATAAAKKMGVRVRMTEGNTCYRGGKPGMSDVFAAALWGADYALLLASNNYSGINLHGGTGKSVANSVGGFLPGDAMLKGEGDTAAEIATHPHPFYSPIATFGTEYVLEPVAYGLKFANLLSSSSFLQGGFTETLQSTGINATAYAARLNTGKLRLIVLNKDPHRDLELTLRLGELKVSKVAAQSLHAPSLESREATISSVHPAGQLRGGAYAVTIPHASGLCLTFQ